MTDSEQGTRNDINDMHCSRTREYNIMAVSTKANNNACRHLYLLFKMMFLKGMMLGPLLVTPHVTGI